MCPTALPPIVHISDHCHSTRERPTTEVTCEACEVCVELSRAFVPAGSHMRLGAVRRQLSNKRPRRSSMRQALLRHIAQLPQLTPHGSTAHENKAHTSALASNRCNRAPSNQFGALPSCCNTNNNNQAQVQQLFSSYSTVQAQASIVPHTLTELSSRIASEDAHGNASLIAFVSCWRRK